MMKAQLLHFDATDRKRWMIRFPSRDRRTHRPEDGESRGAPTGDSIKVFSAGPTFVMLFDGKADPSAIVAGDFQSHRVIAPGWPNEGRKASFEGSLLDIPNTKNGLSPSHFLPNLRQEPRTIPAHRYVAFRQGSRCVVLFQCGTTGHEVNDWTVSLTPEEMGIVLDGLKPGMKDVWKAQHEPDCRFQLEPLAAFYEAS